jgi:hypothetical protein
MEIILIKKNEHGEFEVPAPTSAEIYFTDDQDDATGTAKIIHGDNIHCLFRRGTYDKGE